MANNIDFILRNGLQVMANVAVGSYATQNLAPVNGLIISGDVGIGTSTPGSNLDVDGFAAVRNDLSVEGAFSANSVTSNTFIAAQTLEVIDFTASGNVIVNNLVSNTNITSDTLNTIAQATVNSLVSNTNITTSTLNSTGAVVVQSLNSNTRSEERRVGKEC